MTDANDFLMSGGSPAFKFVNINDTAEGEVVDLEVQTQTDFESKLPLAWPDGNPKLQVKITLDTNVREGAYDDGRRAVFAKGQMQAAIREAVKAAGCQRLEKGGYLTVTHVGVGEPSRKAFAPPKLFSAVYKPASSGGIAVEDL